MRHTVLVLVISIMPNLVFGWTRSVDVISELKSAFFYGVVEIISYDTCSFTFEIGAYEGPDIPITITVFNQVTVKPLSKDTLITLEIINRKAINAPYGIIDYETTPFYTSFWPQIDDTVFVIVDSIYQVSLFGQLQDDYYRIWSPYETGSSASFLIEHPIVILSESKEDCYSSPTANITRCVDGCLLPKDFAMKLDFKTGKFIYQYDLKAISRTIH